MKVFFLRYGLSCGHDYLCLSPNNFQNRNLKSQLVTSSWLACSICDIKMNGGAYAKTCGK